MGIAGSEVRFAFRMPAKSPVSTAIAVNSLAPGIAEEEIARRQIPLAWLDLLLDAPKQRIPQEDRKEILQSGFTAKNG